MIDLIFRRETDQYSNDCSPICTAAKDAGMMLMRHEANLRHLEAQSVDHLGSILLSRKVQEILQLLVNNGSRVTPATRSVYQSALTIAVQRGPVDIVNALLKRGADMYDRNVDNMLAIDMASYNGHRYRSISYKL